MTLIEKIIAKHQEDREVIKAMRARHAEELRTIEEFQAKREAALLEHGDMTAFAYVTDLYINGRDGKAATEKAKENIALNQTKIEAWLLKMLNQVGEGIRTSFGTVYRTRRESISVSDFDAFTQNVMLQDAAKAINDHITVKGQLTEEELVQLIHDNMHLELLNKAVNKTAILELMGDSAKDGSRPNAPPIGINYTSIATVGVRKA